MRQSVNNHAVFHGTGKNKYNLLNGVALNATAATRTITLDLHRLWSKVRIYVFFTHSAATTVTATPTASLDGTNFASYTSRAVSGGTGTVSAFSDSNAVSDDKNFILEYDVRGVDKLKVEFGGASAGASDLVDVQAVAVAGE